MAFSPTNESRDTVYTSTLIGFTPHALDLEETQAVTPVATPDVAGTTGATVTGIVTNITSFFANDWLALLGIILMILFVILAVRIGLGAVKRLGGVGRRA